MNGIRSSVPVVVLKFHHGSLGIARSLGRLGVPVYGVHPTTGDAALASRYCRETLAWPIEQATPSESIGFLLDLGRRLGRRTILLPTSDRTALLVAENARALKECFDFPDQDPRLLESLISKKEMHRLARSLDIPTAHTLFPTSRREVAECLDQTTFPVMLKAIDGARLEARAGVKMVIVRSRAELMEQYDRLEDPESPNLMIQEYIPGGDDSIWMFNGYFDRDSECVVGFTGQKIRQNPVYTGATSLGVCLANEEVDRTTRRFMAGIGYRGILDIGYRYDARDGSYKVLDVNPRIGQTFRLFVGEGEMDVVRAMYLDVTGQTVPATQPRLGRRWVVEDKDIESYVQYRHDGRITFLQWLRSFRGVEEAAWFSADDLRPFWLMAWNLAVRTVRRVARLGRPASEGQSVRSFRRSCLGAIALFAVGLLAGLGLRGCETSAPGLSRPTELWLADFESSEELEERWRPREVSASLSDSYAAHGQRSVRLEYPVGGAPAFVMDRFLEGSPFHRDWTAYDRLTFSMRNEGSSRVRLILQLKDSGEGRYKKSLFVDPGASEDFELRIGDLDPYLDLSRIAQFNLFRWKPRQTATVHLDAIRLQRDSAREPASDAAKIPDDGERGAGEGGSRPGELWLEDFESDEELEERWETREVAAILSERQGVHERQSVRLRYLSCGTPSFVMEQFLEASPRRRCTASASASSARLTDRRSVPGRVPRRGRARGL